jgi:putative nucleotidyltransferase with HDIG domain
MSKISSNEVQRAAMHLMAAIKSVSFYPQSHPAVRQPLQELAGIFGNILKEQPEIHLGIVKGVFFMEDHLVVSPNAAVSALVERLTKKEIDALTIYVGVTPEDLFQFAALLARRETTSDMLTKELEKNGVRTIRLGIDHLAYGGSDHEAGSAQSQTYFEALSVIRDVIREIEQGGIPSSNRINTVVGTMVTETMKDHTTLLGLAMIKDYDNYTFNHSVNVGILALALGAYIGMTREELRDTNTAGLLHDIGKTGIDKSILNKPGKLTAEEYEQIKKHPEMGAVIIDKMKDIHHRVADAVLGHHIKFNRSGYPEWAKERIFGTISEIVAVADCYDAATTLRTYSTPVSPREAIDIMHRLAGTSLNGTIVGKFEEMMGKYPVGTLVRLDTNEIALVVKPHPMENKAPSLKVIIDSSGEVLEKPELISLAVANGNRPATIVSQVNPLLKNVDVSNYLLA